MIGDTDARRLAIHQHPLVISGVSQPVNDVQCDINPAFATK
jgi:hypothetical protein